LPVRSDLDSLIAAVGEAPLMIDLDVPGALTLWFNRPQKRNALNLIMHDSISRVCERLHGLQQIRLMFIRGVGGAFTAGMDLAEPRGPDSMGTLRRIAAMYRMLSAVPQLTVALIEGAAVGAGTGLAAVCDEAIATEKAYFGCPEVKVGLIPAVISPYVIGAVGVRNARRLFMTGRRIDSAGAKQIGLVGEVVKDASELSAAAARIFDEIREAAPGASRDAKRLSEFAGRTLDESLETDTIDRIRRRMEHEEAREGLRAFRDKRKPGWTSIQ
jgi:methylglutaconyl-CoA hydratase